jgi:hypothetical protein
MIWLYIFLGIFCSSFGWMIMELRKARRWRLHGPSLDERAEAMVTLTRWMQHSNSKNHILRMASITVFADTSLNRDPIITYDTESFARSLYTKRKP